MNFQIVTGIFVVVNPVSFVTSFGAARLNDKLVSLRPREQAL